jgi:peptide/nickel transport system permease protein
MLSLVLRRLLGAIGAILGASLIGFVLLRILPGNPAQLILGPLAQKHSVQHLTDQLGLNKPILTQYWHYISDFFTGEWGFSYSAGEPVRSEIGRRMWASIELGLAAFVLALACAVVLALLSSYRRRSHFDRATRAAAYVGYGMPPYWLALILIIVFSVTLHALPGPEGRLSSNVAAPPTVTHLYVLDALIAGQWSTLWDVVRHLILPAVALATAPGALLTRILRASLLEVAGDGYVGAARAKGVPRWRAFVTHALPNAALPVLTASGLTFAYLLSGSVLVEKVFDWPGVGAFIVDSTLSKDFAVVQAFIFLSAILYVIVNVLVDIGYGLLDPRIRHQAQAS